MRRGEKTCRQEGLLSVGSEASLAGAGVEERRKRGNKKNKRLVRYAEERKEKKEGNSAARRPLHAVSNLSGCRANPMSTCQVIVIQQVLQSLEMVCGL